MKIYLVGFMGCGKSTIGKRLAKKIKYNFIDLDNFIEEKAGNTISEIFSKYGEAEFRRLETKYLKEASELENVIISTGGGVPCFANNIEIMKQSGTIIYLQLDNKSLANRLRNSKKQDRPLIAGMSDTELDNFIFTKMHEREPFYNQADLIVNTINLNIAELVLTLENRVFSKISHLKK